MPDQLMPDQMAATIADLNRRLQILEATQRVGLNRVRFAWSTHSSTAAPVSTMDAWESGPVAATWADDQGNSGTGYPSLSVVTGYKALILGSARYLDIANDAAFKASAVGYGVGLDGGTPATISPLRPLMNTGATQGLTSEGFTRLSLITGRNDLAAGAHTFQAQAFWQTGLGGATLPKMYDILLAVIPID